MLGLIILIAAIVACVWTPIEVNKVRNGWKPKKFKGDHAAFVVKYRRQMGVVIGVGIGLAVLNVVLAVLASDNETAMILQFVSAAIWAAVAVVGLLSRRKLDDMPATTPAAPQGGA